MRHALAFACRGLDRLMLFAASNIRTSCESFGCMGLGVLWFARAVLYGLLLLVGLAARDQSLKASPGQIKMARFFMRAQVLLGVLAVAQDTVGRLGPLRVPTGLLRVRTFALIPFGNCCAALPIPVACAVPALVLLLREGFPQATQARSLIRLPTGSLLMDNLARPPPHGIWVYPLRKLRGLCVCGKRIKCSPEPSCLGPEIVRR